MGETHLYIVSHKTTQLLNTKKTTRVNIIRKEDDILNKFRETFIFEKVPKKFPLHAELLDQCRDAAWVLANASGIRPPGIALLQSDA